MFRAKDNDWFQRCKGQESSFTKASATRNSGCRKVSITFSNFLVFWTSIKSTLHSISRTPKHIHLKIICYGTPDSRERVLIEPTSIRNTGHSYFLRHQLYNLQNVSCNKLCSKSILCQILDSEIGSFNVLFYVHKQQFLLYFVFGFLFIYYKCSDLHLPTWLNPMR